MIKPDFNNYKKERQEWIDKGSPLRSEEKILEIFTICSECDKHIDITQNMVQCSVCTCFIRKYGTKLNKGAFATTRCPLEEPKWVEEPGFEQIETKEEIKETEPEVPVQPQFNSRKKKGGTGGCGCV